MSIKINTHAQVRDIASSRPRLPVLLSTHGAAQTFFYRFGLPLIFGGLLSSATPSALADLAQTDLTQAASAASATRAETPANQRLTSTKPVFQFDIPELSADKALTRFAEQAGLTLVFPYDQVREYTARPLYGRYRVFEAVERLLQGTPLLATFSEPSSGTGLSVLTISIPENGQATKRGLLARLIQRLSGGTRTANAQHTSRHQNNQNLEEVLVTAQRREQNLQDVPITLSALSAQQLSSAGVVNLFDLQHVVSGLTFGGVGNLTQPAIRGLSTGVSTNGSENPNAFYIDDVYYSQGNLLGASLPDVERIEVLKGPQGTLFGRNSVGGAIRVFTKKPGFEPTLDLTVDNGYYTGDGASRSSQHTAVRGFASTPLIDNTLALSISGDYDETEGFLTDAATGEQFGTIRRANVRSKLLLQANDSLSLLFSAFYLDHNDEGLQSQTPVDGLVVANAPQFADAIVPRQPYYTAYNIGNGLEYNDALVQSSGASATLQWSLEDIGDLTAISAYHDTEVSNQTTLTHSQSNSCMTSLVCIDYYYFATNKAISQEFTFNATPSDSINYTVGLFYYQQDSSTDTAIRETVVPGGVPIKLTRFNIESFAAYGEVEFSPSDNWTFIAGGRYTYEPHRDRIVLPDQIDRKKTFTSFIPRLSAQYRLSPNTTVYASYAVGEKSGLAGVDNGASNPPYQSVEPEENHAYELGIKFASADLSMNLSSFYYDYKNKQEQGFNGSAVFVQNTGPVRIFGFDTDFSYLLTPELMLRANASWVPEAEYRDFPDAAAYGYDRLTTDAGPQTGAFRRQVFNATGQRLAKAPEFTANLSLSYRRPLASGTLDASTTLSYSSTVYHDIFHVIEQSPYSTLSMQLGYRFADSGLRLSLFGRNLGNEDYIAHGFPSSQGFTAAYARPREIGLSLNLSY